MKHISIIILLFVFLACNKTNNNTNNNNNNSFLVTFTSSAPYNINSKIQLSLSILGTNPQASYTIISSDTLTNGTTIIIPNQPFMLPTLPFINPLYTPRALGPKTISINIKNNADGTNQLSTASFIVTQFGFSASSLQYPAPYIGVPDTIIANIIAGTPNATYILLSDSTISYNNQIQAPNNYFNLGVANAYKITFTPLSSNAIAVPFVAKDNYGYTASDTAFVVGATKFNLKNKPIIQGTNSVAEPDSIIFTINPNGAPSNTTFTAQLDSPFIYQNVNYAKKQTVTLNNLKDTLIYTPQNNSKKPQLIMLRLTDSYNNIYTYNLSFYIN